MRGVPEPMVPSCLLRQGGFARAVADGRERAHPAGVAGEWVAVWGAGVGFQSRIVRSAPAEVPERGSPVSVVVTASADTCRRGR